MNFTDFEPKELVGKPVLLTSGYSYARSLNIQKIATANKRWFTLEGSETKYRITSGSEISGGLYHSKYCKLLAPEEEIKIREELDEADRVQKLRNQFEEEYGSFKKTANSKGWERLIKALTE